MPCVIDQGSTPRLTTPPTRISVNTSAGCPRLASHVPCRCFVQAGGSVALFKYHRSGNTANWELLTNVAHPNFYDLNEDSASDVPLWHLEIDESEVDHPVGTDLRLTGSPEEKRITFLAGSEVYCLKFPTKETYAKFYQEFNHKLFENTYQTEYGEAAEVKIFGEDYSNWARGQDGEGADWTAEPMNTEVHSPTLWTVGALASAHIPWKAVRLPVFCSSCL